MRPARRGFRIPGKGIPGENGQRLIPSTDRLPVNGRRAGSRRESPLDTVTAGTCAEAITAFKYPSDIDLASVTEPLLRGAGQLRVSQSHLWLVARTPRPSLTYAADADAGADCRFAICRLRRQFLEQIVLGRKVQLSYHASPSGRRVPADKRGVEGDRTSRSEDRLQVFLYFSNDFEYLSKRSV